MRTTATVISLAVITMLIGCAHRDHIDVTVTRTNDQWSIVVERAGHVVANSNGPVNGPNTTSLVSIVDRTRIAVHIAPANVNQSLGAQIARRKSRW